MATKDKLLTLLEGHKGSYFSGEEIAALLQVSRTAVWKAVKALQAEGYKIDAVQNKGYCLDADTDILSEQGIRNYLEPEWSFPELEVLPTAASTNSILRQKANAGSPEGCTVIAAAQTEGRGRLGRKFYSPPDTGIYLSLLLRPENDSPLQAMKVTTMAAVAACEAIEAVSGRKAEIKWVNDIYMDGRKVCGILTEGLFQMETGSLDFVILGMGMNVYEPDSGFPEELAGIAGAVFHSSQEDGKNRLAAAFLNHFCRYYYGDWNFAEAYRRRSLVIGKEIQVLRRGEQRAAIALDVDGDCRLIVRYGDGTVETLSSAEISVRLDRKKLTKMS